jgi:protein-tyrosine phosphatase
VTITPVEPSTSTSSPANLRDVRGLRTDDGRIVRRAVLYRSEVPLAGPAPSAGHVPGQVPGQITDVAVWPPATVIDLRSRAELLGPHPLAGVAAVHLIPLGATLAPALAAAQTSDPDLTFAYQHLVRDAAAQIAGIVGLVATGPGPVLVHCTAGKDRTGIVIAVLLRAIGVRRADILTDYLRTEANLPRLWTALRVAGVPEPHNRALLGVQATALEAVLDDVESAPGGAAGWLLTHGVDPDELALLGHRLLSPVAVAGR